MSKERIVVYVDGYNVYYGMKRKEWKHLLWLNYRSFFESVSTSDQEITAVHYFTAKSNSHESQRRQQVYLNAIEAFGGVNIHLGHIASRPSKCKADPSCNGKWKTPQEKESDVRLALQMASDGMDKLADTVWLMTRDSDLCPAVEMVRERFGTKVVVLPPPDGSGGAGGASSLEQVSGNRKFHVQKRHYVRNQFPDELEVGRKRFVRPPEWGHQRMG